MKCSIIFLHFYSQCVLNKPFIEYIYIYMSVCMCIYVYIYIKTHTVYTVYLYIHNKYTQYTQINNVHKDVYFGCS